MPPPGPSPVASKRSQTSLLPTGELSVRVITRADLRRHRFCSQLSNEAPTILLVACGRTSDDRTNMPVVGEEMDDARVVTTTSA